MKALTISIIALIVIIFLIGVLILYLNGNAVPWFMTAAVLAIIMGALIYITKNQE